MFILANVIRWMCEVSEIKERIKGDAFVVGVFILSFLFYCLRLSLLVHTIDGGGSDLDGLSSQATEGQEIKGDC